MAKYSGSQPGTIASNRKPRGLPRIIRNSDSIKPNEDSFGRTLRSIRGIKRLHSWRTETSDGIKCKTSICKLTKTKTDFHQLVLQLIYILYRCLIMFHINFVLFYSHVVHILFKSVSEWHRRVRCWSMKTKHWFCIL